MRFFTSLHFSQAFLLNFLNFSQLECTIASLTEYEKPTFSPCNRVDSQVSQREFYYVLSFVGKYQLFVVAEVLDYLNSVTVRCLAGLYGAVNFSENWTKRPYWFSFSPKLQLKVFTYYVLRVMIYVLCILSMLIIIITLWMQSSTITFIRLRHT